MKILNFAKQRKFNNQLITGHHILDIKVSPWFVCLDLELLNPNMDIVSIDSLVEYFKNSQNQDTLLSELPNLYDNRTELGAGQHKGDRMKAFTVSAKSSLNFITTDIPDLINIIKYYLNVDVEKFIQENN